MHKRTGTFSTSCSPVHGPVRVSSCDNSMPHHLNPSLFLSLLFLHGKGSPHSVALLFSLPQLASTHLTQVNLFPSNCRDPPATLHFNFLGVQSNLTSIKLNLRDLGSPGSSYFSAILNQASTLLVLILTIITSLGIIIPILLLRNLRLKYMS